MPFSKMKPWFEFNCFELKKLEAEGFLVNEILTGFITLCIDTHMLKKVSGLGSYLSVASRSFLIDHHGDLVAYKMTSVCRGCIENYNKALHRWNLLNNDSDKDIVKMMTKDKVLKKKVVKQQTRDVLLDDTCPSYPLIMQLLYFGDTYVETHEACGNPYVESLDIVPIISLSSKDEQKFISLKFEFGFGRPMDQKIKRYKEWLDMAPVSEKGKNSMIVFWLLDGAPSSCSVCHIL